MDDVQFGQNDPVVNAPTFGANDQVVSQSAPAFGAHDPIVGKNDAPAEKPGMFSRAVSALGSLFGGSKLVADPGEPAPRQMPGTEVPFAPVNDAIASVPTDADVRDLQKLVSMADFAQPILRSGLVNKAVADFEAKHGAGSAEHYIGMDAAPRQSEALPYGEGLGYAVNNPVTRGVAQAANSVTAGALETLSQGLGETKASDVVGNAAQHAATEATRLGAPDDAGKIEQTVQGLAPVAAELGAAALLHRALPATRTLPATATTRDMIGNAVRNPAFVTAGALGTEQALRGAGEAEAAGKPMGLADVVNDAMLNTVANQVPLATTGNIGKRVLGAAARVPVEAAPAGLIERAAQGAVAMPVLNMGVAEAQHLAHPDITPAPTLDDAVNPESVALGAGLGMIGGRGEPAAKRADRAAPKQATKTNAAADTLAEALKPDVVARDEIVEPVAPVSRGETAQQMPEQTAEQTPVKASQESAKVTEPELVPVERDTEHHQDEPQPIPTEEHPYAPGNEHILKMPDGTVGTTEPPVQDKRQWAPTGRKDSRGRDIYEPQLDYDRGDGLLEWIAANGGIDFDQIHKQTGVDPALLKDPAVMAPLGKVGISALRRKGGMTLEQLYERMRDDGWFVQHGDDAQTPIQVGLTEAADMAHEALNGQQIYHPYKGADARMQDIANERAAEEARYEFERNEATQAEQAQAAAELRDRQAEFDHADHGEALTTAQWIRRAHESGMTPDEILAAVGTDGPVGERIGKLAQAIEDRSRGAEQRAIPVDRERGAGPDQGRPPADTQRGPPALESQGQATRPRGDLFPPATAREHVRSEAERRTAERNGLNQRSTRSFDDTALGRDVTRRNAPEQTDIESQLPPNPVEEVSESDLSPADRELVQRTRARAEAAKDNHTAETAMEQESRERGEREAGELGLRGAVVEALGADRMANVHFVHDEAGLPADVRKRGTPVAKGNVRYGLHTADGHSYIFTKHANTPAHAVWTAVHEVGGHGGMQAIVRAFGGIKVGGMTVAEAHIKAREILLQNPTVRRIAAVIGKQRKSTDLPRMAEEAFAELQAAKRTGNWATLEDKYGVDLPDSMRSSAIRAMDKFAERVKRILNAIANHALHRDAGEVFSDADVHNMLDAAWEGTREPSGMPLDDNVPHYSEEPAARESVLGDKQPAPELKAGFVERALTRLFPGARDLFSGVRQAIAPMAEGSTEARAASKDFANAMRKARWQGAFADDSLRKNFSRDELQKMWDAADEQSVLEQEGKDTAGKGLDRLTPEQRKFVEILQTDARSVYDQARELGMVSGEGLPSYTPRMVVTMGDNGVRPASANPERPRSAEPIGTNMRTTTGNLKQRRHLTTEETEAAAKARFGEGAEVVRNIRTLPMATARLREAIAGRQLIDKIKAIGKMAGDDVVTTGTQPNDGHRWFTLDHPSFGTWRPRFETDPKTGKTTAVKDAEGNTVFDRVPLYVRADFRGPLTAVLNRPDGPIYRALMSIKARAMSVIMYSPLIHNAVEWGRAMPAMPGKVLTFRVYFEGSKARKDPTTMREAIDAGMAPIGRNFQWQDLSSIQSGEALQPGRSWTAKLASAVPGMFSEKAGDAVKRTVDAMGDFWHNTLLWDRVADLQAGLYVNFRDHLVDKGLAPDSAQRIAAHLSNRYAGSLPKEAMSDMSRKVANFVLFSRSFTLGNLGAMKDAVTGLPRDVQSQILRDAGELERKQAVSFARRKAIATLALDLGLAYAGNALLQSGVAIMLDDKSLSDEERDYVRRAHDALQRVKENPTDLANYDPVNLLPQGDNEPGKRDRVLVGYEQDGTAIYMRNPTGKIGEEFEGWATSPLDMLKRKQGTIMRPLGQLLSNDQGFGRKVYDPSATTVPGVMKNAGRIAWLFVGSQLPTSAIDSVKNVLSGKGKKVDIAQAVGPLAGVTFSRGAPGGPAVGEYYHAKSAQEGRVSAAMPELRQQIRDGDRDGAVQKMLDLGMDRSYIKWVVNSTEHPETRISRGGIKAFHKYATPDEQTRMRRAMDSRARLLDNADGVGNGD